MDVNPVDDDDEEEDDEDADVVPFLTNLLRNI